MNTCMTQCSMNLHLLYKWAESNNKSTADKGYLVHCALRGAFGADAPQPFALQGSKGRGLAVLGYGTADEETLRRHLATAPPLLSRAIPASDIHGKSMPAEWPGGQRLRYSIRCCPVVRSREGRDIRKEQDAFRHATDNAQDELPEREDVYAAWLQKELGRKGAARCLTAELVGFKYINPVRRNNKGRAVKLKHGWPDAIIQGLLEIGDPEAFKQLLSRGCGRHRAFGFGMLLLRPA